MARRLPGFGVLVYMVVSQPISAFAVSDGPPAGELRVAQFFDAPPPATNAPPPARIPDAPPAARDEGAARDRTPARPLDLSPADNAPATPAVEAEVSQPDRSRGRQARQFPRVGPIPPPRPWGQGDASASDETIMAGEDQPAERAGTSPDSVTSARDEIQPGSEEASTLPLPFPRPDVADLPPAAGGSSAEAGAAGTTAAAAPALSPERALVVVVRGNVREPKDLNGKSVASGTSSEMETGELLSQAGLSPKMIELGFAPGLERLARGDVDGVVLSVGPRLSAAETSGLQLGDFRLLQIPLAPAER